MDTKDKKEFTAPYALYIWMALALAFLIAVLSTSGILSRSSRTDKAIRNQSQKTIFIVDYGSSQQKFSGQFSGKVRVWDLLQQAMAISNVDLAATGNFIPYKIDNHQSNTKEGWHYYLNGVLQTEPPFETFASEGDEVKFKWEAYDDAHPKKW